LNYRYFLIGIITLVIFLRQELSLVQELFVVA